MNDFIRWLLLAIAALLLLAAVLAGCAPAPKLRVLDFCDVPANSCGALAELPPEIQAELVEQAWCCTGGDPCVPVEAITDCAITDIAIICEHGRSHPSSGPIGSGFECFG